LLIVGVANLAVLGLILVGHPGAGLGAGPVESPLFGQPAPLLAGTAAAGTPIHLSDYRGRWVIVNFFATWCPGCRAETPELVRFAAEHQTVGDVVVLGVAHGDSLDASRQYLRGYHAGWEVLGDPDGRIASDYLVDGIPESFVIAPDGTVGAGLQGGVRTAQLDHVLAAARPGAPSTAGPRS
jgi:peroxiredoxin